MIKAHHHGLYLRTTRQPHWAARAVLPAVLALAGHKRGVDTGRHLPYAEGATWRACRRPVCLLSHGLAAREPALGSRRSEHGCWCAVWTKGQRAQRRGESVCAFHSEDG